MTVFLRVLGSSNIKTACKHVGDIEPWKKVARVHKEKTFKNILRVQKALKISKRCESEASTENWISDIILVGFNQSMTSSMRLDIFMSHN